MKGHKDDQRTGVSDVQGEAESWEYSAWRRLLGDVINECK